jgi:hypothetical protein
MQGGGKCLFFAITSLLIQLWIAQFQNGKTKLYTAEIGTFHLRSEMEKLSNLMDQYSNLQANEIDRYQFVKAIGYKYSAKTNI